MTISVSVNEKIFPSSWVILFNVITVTILTIISAVAIIIAQTSVIGELGIEGSIQQWIVILYLLGINSVVPIGTSLADRYGFKKIFFIGVLLFGLGSLISGLATSFFILGFGRIIEGLGGGIIFPVGLALILHNFPKKMLPLALNLYIGLGFGIGFGLGAFLGGFFTQFYSWRWIFLINFPIAIFSLFIIATTQKETEKNQLNKFDLYGYITLAFAVCFLIIALTNGNLRSTTDGWRSPFIIGCIIISIISFLTCLMIEKNHPKPVLPLKLFKYPIFVIGIFTLFSLGMIVFGSITLISNFMEQGLKFQKFTTGALLTTYGISIGIFSVLSTYLLKNIPILAVVLMGLALIVFSNVLSYKLTFLSDKTMIATILIIRGIGVGLSLGSTNTYALKNIPKEFSSDAATLLTFFRQLGATYGGSILTIITIRREFFYNAIFKEGLTSESIGFQETVRKLSMFIAKNNGNTFMIANQRAKELIADNVFNQSFIQAMNDGLIVLAWILAIKGLAMFILNLSKKKPPNITP
jgi:MFS transporter, DHA2 family, multidrug resistance protein